MGSVQLALGTLLVGSNQLRSLSKCPKNGLCGPRDSSQAFVREADFSSK
jgi:hypothetical protein